MADLTWLTRFTHVSNREEINTEFVGIAGVGLAGGRKDGLTLPPRVARDALTPVVVDLCVHVYVCVGVGECA